MIIRLIPQKLTRLIRMNREIQYGITQYVDKQRDYVLFGIVKQRYSDFHVHIDSTNGEVVHLKNITRFDNVPLDDDVQQASANLHETQDLPSTTIENVDQSQTTTTVAAKVEEEDPLTSLDTKLKEFQSVLDDENSHKLKLFIENLIKQSEQTNSISISIKIPTDKGMRTKVHELIRENFPSFGIVSSTSQDETKQIIISIGSKSQLQKEARRANASAYSGKKQQQGYDTKRRKTGMYQHDKNSKRGKLLGFEYSDTKKVKY